MTWPAPAPCASRYLVNLAALYRSSPDLAARIDALPFSACPALEATRDGYVTARLIADDGKLVYAHSRYRPQEEACKFVAAQRKGASSSGQADDDTAEDSRSFFVAGLGLGYHLRELERQCDHPRLIVAEDDLALVKAAFCVTDLSEPLADGRLVLLPSADKALFHETLRPINADVLLGLQYVTLPHAGRYHAAFHAQARELLMDFVAFARLQMVTLLRNARITCKNIAFNTPAYLARAGVEVLKGRTAGYPAVIVAAGPSLARNIDQLPGLRDRAVLIAVQTVFKTLLARRVPPHFVTSLDFHEVSAQFFHGVEDVGDCILVAEPKATWHVLDAFRGRTHVLHNDLYGDLLREVAPRHGVIKAGSTVAHLAFYLAEHLGCDPIILVGQDLSYSEGLYYPPGMPIERIWQPELGRFCTLEMKQWERIVRARPILRVVKDIHGRDVYTDEQLFTYAEQFQSDFSGSPARVIHACEGGMRLLGTEVMTLREAGERFCTRRLPPDLFAAGAEAAPPELRDRTGRWFTSGWWKSPGSRRSPSRCAGSWRSWPSWSSTPRSSIAWLCAWTTCARLSANTTAPTRSSPGSRSWPSCGDTPPTAESASRSTRRPKWPGVGCGVIGSSWSRLSTDVNIWKACCRRRWSGSARSGDEDRRGGFRRL